MQQRVSEKTPEAAPQEAGWPDRSLLAMFGIFLRGITMGAADIVPGVSGGIDALLHLRIREALSMINWSFLVPLGLGVVAAIFSLAGALEYFLTHQPVYIWSFFFGLIIASVIVIAGRIQQWSLGVVGAVLLGAVGTYFLVSLVPAQTPDTWWFYILTGALASAAMILPGISGAYILVMRFPDPGPHRLWRSHRSGHLCPDPQLAL